MIDDAGRDCGAPGALKALRVPAVRDHEADLGRIVGFGARIDQGLQVSPPPRNQNGKPQPRHAVS